jgi:hypothetical protein
MLPLVLVIISLNPSSSAEFTSKKEWLSIKKTDLAKKIVSDRKHLAKTMAYFFCELVLKKIRGATCRVFLGGIFSFLSDKVSCLLHYLAPVFYFT